MSEYWVRVKKIQADNEQKTVFNEDKSRVVIAGPGSGKTYLLTTKVAKLLHTGVVKTPHRIACLTYSNFLANQLREDLQALEVLDDERIFVGTVHSFCIGEVILPFQKLYELQVPTPLRIASWERMLEATAIALQKQNLNPPNTNDRAEKRLLEDITRKLSNYRRLYWDNPQPVFPENTSKIQQRYPALNWAKFAGDYSLLLWETDQPAVDFVHLEIEALKTIQTYPLVQQFIANRFKWLFVDEYQDLGQPFHKMMLCLIQNTSIKVIAIGDPDQCIYEELQGSKPELIYELSEAIQENGGADKVTLKTNYRSTQEIINLSEVVLGENRGYKSSDNQTSPIWCISYPTEASQQNLILRLLNYLTRKETGPGIPIHEVAILHPKRKARSWKGEIGINEISTRLDEHDWKNALDKDPEYDNRFNLIQWVENLAHWCAKDSFLERPFFIDLLPPWIELIEHYQGHIPLEEQFGYEKKLFEVLWSLRNAKMSLREWLDTLRNRLQLDQIIESYGGIRPDDAKEFFHLCEATKDGNRLPNWDIARFAQTGQRIQLTTLHSSKGSQFEAVIVAGFDRVVFWERANSPTDQDKRLAYVSVTRAKKYLFLLYSDQNAYFVSQIKKFSDESIKFYELNE